MPVHHVEEFRVLVVCTANLCRSPIGQFLLDRSVQSIWPAVPQPWQVQSAGTAAREEPDMHPLAAQVLGERQVTTGPFLRTALRAELVAEADLVLTAGAAHRSAVIRLLPTATGHTFTLRQFGRLCADLPTAPGGQTPAGAGRWLVEQARARRGHLGVVDAGADELVDPLGAGKRAFRRCADTVQGAIDSMVAPLRPR